MTELPEVWIGCLSCYNGGRLVGNWFDASSAGEVTVEEVHAVAAGLGVADTVYANHEELWCLDHQGFGGLLKGECSPTEAQRIAELIEDLDDGFREALAAFLDNRGEALDSEEIDRFEEAYCGVYDSEAAYAESFAEDCGFVAPEGWPGSYIDWERAGRDLFLGGDNWATRAPGGQLHVFRGI